jgi:Fur family transcriptional regulator, ferric uptake regulator
LAQEPLLKAAVLPGPHDEPFRTMSFPPAQLDEVRRIFRGFLKERSQRQTPERFAVLDEIYASPDHMDADEIFLRMKGKGSRVSRATVYNTLDLLMECNLVVRHQFGSNQAKYERAFSYWQHDHLICIDCNELFEFCDPRLQSIQEMIGEIYNFDVKHHSLNLYGHCRRENCPNRPAAPEE